MILPIEALGSRVDGRKESGLGTRSGFRDRFERPGWDEAVAEWISWVFNPIAYCTAFLAALTARHPEWWTATAVLWGFLAVAPGVLLWWGVQRGWWSDFDVSQLGERRTYMPWVVVLGAGAVVAAWVGHFPPLLRFTAGSILLWLALSTFIGRRWKISLHVGGATGILWLTAVAFGAVWGAMLLWVPWAVGWARLRLNRHTPAQVWAGALAGTVSVALVFHAMGWRWSWR
ncbi:MAG: hypothetical protein K6U14_04470 [Firmicutes bacterium]|nr:hypothetical protein [Alicyclobacillaceae bacterium]MCL6496876.1 hypothetical protein [Bacillota bacterium]